MTEKNSEPQKSSEELIKDMRKSIIENMSNSSNNVSNTRLLETIALLLMDKTGNGGD